MQRILIATMLALALTACDDGAPTAPTVPDVPAAPTTQPADASAAAAYPLNVCIVSGEALGSMGDPVVQVHNGQEVKFCCEGCTGEFSKDPAKYLAKLK